MVLFKHSNWVKLQNWHSNTAFDQLFPPVLNDSRPWHNLIWNFLTKTWSYLTIDNWVKLTHIFEHYSLIYVRFLDLHIKLVHVLQASVALSFILHVESHFKLLMLIKWQRLLYVPSTSHQLKFWYSLESHFYGNNGHLNV